MHATKRLIVTTLCLVLWATGVASHEFWIDPERFQAESGARIVANFRNGERFEGVTLGYFDRSSDRLQMALGNDVRDIEPRNGDRPAIDHPPLGEGLHVLLHEAAPSTVTYKTWDKFAAFAAHKDFPRIESRHEARDLPRQDFTELYTRHVKALVAVGNGTGRDRNFGMETEFVAQTNPYAPDYTGEMVVRLFHDGAPRSDAQVEIFEKDEDGRVSISLTRTDAEGFARFETKPGRVYLIDSVVLREPEDAAQDAAWETLWAALTFAVPAP